MEYYTISSVETNKFTKLIEKLIKLDAKTETNHRLISDMKYYIKNKEQLNIKRYELYKQNKDTAEFKLKKNKYNKNYSTKQKAKLI